MSGDSSPREPLEERSPEELEEEARLLAGAPPSLLMEARRDGSESPEPRLEDVAAAEVPATESTFVEQGGTPRGEEEAPAQVVDRERFTSAVLVEGDGEEVALETPTNDTGAGSFRLAAPPAAVAAAEEPAPAPAEGNGPSPERVKLEHAALLRDLGSLKAKCTLTFQSLRSILCLGAEASWADLLEHCEQLAHTARTATGAPPGEAVPVVPCPPNEELQQAELECEQLEEKLEAQTAHIGRLRELLQKQQGLLDMTAHQFETQHEQSEQQKQRLAALERRDFQQQETIAAQEHRIAELSARCDSLQGQLQVTQGIAAKQTRVAAEQAAKVVDLQEELLSKDNSLASLSSERQQTRAEGEMLVTEANAEIDRRGSEIRELEDALYKQGDLVERMTEQLQIHEAADRRRYSYRPRRGGEGTTLNGCLEDECGGSEPGSVCSTARLSARGPASDAGYASMPPPVSSRSSTVAASQVTTPRTQTKSGGATAPLSEMTDEERIRFLAHFPMASRTERHLRNRLEERKRVVPTTTMK